VGRARAISVMLAVDDPRQWPRRRRRQPHGTPGVPQVAVRKVLAVLTCWFAVLRITHLATPPNATAAFKAASGTAS